MDPGSKLIDPLQRAGVHLAALRFRAPDLPIDAYCRLRKLDAN
jgi:hypothetical protein